MLTSVLQIILSTVPLLFGRRLFGVFVAVAGFLVGLALSGLIMSAQSEWVYLLLGIIVGLVGGLLAVYLTKPMAAVGGFLALGSAALLLSIPLGMDGMGRWIFFVVAGLMGAFLVFVLLDWALIINSGICGATGIAAGISGLFGNLSSLVYLVIVVVLLMVGIVYQLQDWRAGSVIIGIKEPVT